MPTIIEEQSSRFQITIDSFLAWQLQAQEYRKHLQDNQSIDTSSSSTPKLQKTPYLYTYIQADGTSTLFKVESVNGDGDCFFHAVNKPNLTRETLVKKLHEHPTEEVRAVFAIEICQFLYLGWANYYANEQDKIAGQTLLTDEIKTLFSELTKAEAMFSAVMDKARTELGELESKSITPDGLLDKLKYRNSNCLEDFQFNYEKIQFINNEIYKFCSRMDVFQAYVTLYLDKAKGYIPFHRDLSKTISTTTIDIINELFQLNIQIYLPETSTQNKLLLVNRKKIENAIPIFHDGINHFSQLKTINIASVIHPIAPTTNNQKNSESSSNIRGIPLMPSISRQQSAERQCLWTDSFEVKNLNHLSIKADSEPFKPIKDLLRLLKGGDGSQTNVQKNYEKDMLQFLKDLNRSPLIKIDEKIVYRSEWFVDITDFMNATIHIHFISQEKPINLNKNLILIQYKLLPHGIDNQAEGVFEITYNYKRNIQFEINTSNNPALYIALIHLMTDHNGSHEVNGLIREVMFNEMRPSLSHAIIREADIDREKIRKQAIDQFLGFSEKTDAPFTPEEMKYCLRTLHQGIGAEALMLTARVYKFGEDHEKIYDCFGNASRTQIHYERNGLKFLLRVHIPVHYLVYDFNERYEVPLGKTTAVPVVEIDSINNTNTEPKNEKIFTLTLLATINLNKLIRDASGHLIHDAEAIIIVKGFLPKFRYIGPSWEVAFRDGIEINLESDCDYAAHTSIDTWINHLLHDEKKLKNSIKKFLTKTLADIREHIKRIIRIHSLEPQSNEKLLSNILSLFQQAQMLGELKKTIDNFSNSIRKNVQNSATERATLFNTLFNLQGLFIDNLRNKKCGFHALLELAGTELSIIFSKLNPSQIVVFYDILNSDFIQNTYASAAYLVAYASEVFMDLYPELDLNDMSNETNVTIWNDLKKKIISTKRQVITQYDEVISPKEQWKLTVDLLLSEYKKQKKLPSDFTLQKTILNQSIFETFSEINHVLNDRSKSPFKFNVYTDSSDKISHDIIMLIQGKYEDNIVRSIADYSSFISANINYTQGVLGEIIKANQNTLIIFSPNMSKVVDNIDQISPIFKQYLIQALQKTFSASEETPNPFDRESLSELLDNYTRAPSPEPRPSRKRSSLRGSRRTNSEIPTIETITSIVNEHSNPSGNLIHTPATPRSYSSSFFGDDTPNAPSPLKSPSSTAADPNILTPVSGRSSSSRGNSSLTPLSSPVATPKHKSGNQTMTLPSPKSNISPSEHIFHREKNVFLNPRRELITSEEQTRSDNNPLEAMITPPKQTQPAQTCLAITIPEGNENAEIMPLDVGNTPPPYISGSTTTRIIRYALAKIEQVRHFSSGEIGAALWADNQLFVRTIIGGCSVFYSLDQLLTPYPAQRLKAQLALMAIELASGLTSIFSARHSVLHPKHGKGFAAIFCESLSYTLKIHVYLTNIAIAIEELAQPDKQSISDLTWFVGLNGVQFILFLPSMAWRLNIKNLRSAISPGKGIFIDNTLEFLLYNAILHIGQKVCHLIPADPQMKLILQSPSMVVSAGIVFARNRFPTHKNRIFAGMLYFAVLNYIALFIENIVNPHSIYPTASNGIETFNAEVWARTIFYTLSFVYSIYFIGRYGLEFVTHYKDFPSVAIIPAVEDEIPPHYQPLDDGIAEVIISEFSDQGENNHQLRSLDDQQRDMNHKNELLDRLLPKESKNSSCWGHFFSADKEKNESTGRRSHSQSGCNIM
ncbi:MAG: hypothetical protein ACOVQX_00275 [Legionella sp.]